MDYLAELKKMALDLKVMPLVAKVLNDPRFSIWSGSPNKDVHHYGDGGLLKHTYEVVCIAVGTANFYNTLKPFSINVQEVFVSAVWHDYGKIWDYEKDLSRPILEGLWQSADHKYKVYHIVRSALEWEKNAERWTVADYNVNSENILHNILAHHGKFEWKSPVLPQTKEAWILHTADCMSARVDDGSNRK